MAGWRQAVELAMTDEEIAALMALSRSRTEPASRVSRDVDPLNGEEVANLVEQLSRAPAETVTRVRTALEHRQLPYLLRRHSAS